MFKPSINRRAFIKVSGLASGAGILGGGKLSLAADIASVAEPAAQGIDFIDRRWVAQTYFLARQVTQGERFLPGPVMDEHTGQATIQPARDGGFVMWYSTLHGTDQHWINHATTRDGIHFEKPDLGLREHNGSKHNNIVLRNNETDADGRAFSGAAGNKGFCIIDAQHEPAPNTRGRYTALYLSNTPGRPTGLHVAWSDDGFHWKAYPENPVYPGWPDTFNNFFFDQKLGRYVLYTRASILATTPDKRSANRMMARVESDDLVHWRNEQTVLDTDDRDAAAAGTVNDAKTPLGEEYPRGRDGQFYGMIVRPYQNLYLGFAQYYDVVPGRMWCELVYSYDGIDWKREPKREPFIALGDKGAWDSGMVMWIPKGCPFPVGDDWYFYYSGSNFNHHAKAVAMAEKGQILALGIVRLKRGRLVGYTAGKEPGFLLTKPFVANGSTIVVNANAKSGKLLVGVCDHLGRALNELGLAEAVPIREDGLRLAVRFNGAGSLEKCRGQIIRLRMQLSNASVYGLAFG